MAENRRKPGLRRDAARNRELLVTAAAEAFGAQGLGASVNAIAASAGVNVATLYRHFPTKDHLVAAVLETMLAPLRVAREEALVQPGTGGELGAFVRAAARVQGQHRGLVDVMAQEPHGAEVRARLRALAEEIVEPIVVAGRASGELRPDFDPVDLLIALRMVAVVATSATVAERDLERYVALVLRGLRPD